MLYRLSYINRQFQKVDIDRGVRNLMMVPPLIIFQEENVEQLVVPP